MLKTSMSITLLIVLQSIGFSHNHPLMDNLNIRVLKFSIIALITLCTVDISYQAISGQCAAGFIQSRASFCD